MKVSIIIPVRNEELVIKKIINQIIFSYEKFFVDLNSYNYVNFKKKADLMALN